MASKHEGILWKWTNYWNGWQPRFWVLDKGVLSYYLSQEQVNQGCKGSVCVATAEISAHPTDAYRLDVVVPGEQHFYLKAASPYERQQWLHVLGTVKSCLNSEKASKELIEGDLMRKKQGELRLISASLMQQVYQIKSVVTENPIPDVKQLDESTALFEATCNTFICTLEECLKLAKLPHSDEVMSVNTSARKSVDDHSIVRPMLSGGGVSPGHHHHGHSRKGSASRTKSQSIADSDGHTSPHHHQVAKSNSFKTDLPRTYVTFFTKLPSSFANVRLNEDSSIPTGTFLEACESFSRIFDLLGSTAFAPVQMDILSNIRKITMRFEADRSNFATIQSIVEAEQTKGTAGEPNSATDALVWLTRCVAFLREFLHLFQSGEPNLSECASVAYSETLKSHHGWVVRGIFAMAIKAIPPRSDFISSLTVIPTTLDDLDRTAFTQQLSVEINSYVAGIDRCLKSISSLFQRFHLDSADPKCNGNA